MARTWDKETSRAGSHPVVYETERPILTTFLNLAGILRVKP
jgi:hypothetical protein